MNQSAVWNTNLQDKMICAGMQGGCITYHPGFKHVCLHEYVLQLTYLLYRQQCGSRAMHHIQEKSK